VSKTKYVSYRERGFYVYDVALGVFLQQFFDAAEASEHVNTEWLMSAVSDWRVSACIQDIGMTLDERWSTSQCQTIVALAEEACRTLEQRDSIPAKEIVQWRILDDEHIFPRGAMEVSTAPIIELGRAIIALVEGNLPIAPEGKAWFYGTEKGRQILALRP
jgi:hypothetical protein